MKNICFNMFIGKRVIQINDMYPILIFDKEASLTIQCPWRLKNGNTIVVGSGDYKLQKTHQKTNNMLCKFLLGQKINNIGITSAICDLTIEFSNGMSIEVFSDSSIYENWTLSDGRDFLLVSLPGGKTSSLIND